MNDERGNSLIEAILLGLLLIVPIVWTMGVLSEIHRAALAGATAARAAGSDAARAESVGQAESAVKIAVEDAFSSQDLEANRVRIQWSADPGFPRGGMLEIEVSYPVEILSAPLLGEVGGPLLWIDAAHVARIDPYRSR